jgi:hypothetical protein
MNVTTRELMDPRGIPQIGARGLSPRLDSLDGKTIGLLDNGKPNFNLFLADLALLLRASYPSVRIVQRMKPIVPRPVPKDMLVELADTCDAVVTGLGD